MITCPQLVTRQRCWRLFATVMVVSSVALGARMAPARATSAAAGQWEELGPRPNTIPQATPAATAIVTGSTGNIGVVPVANANRPDPRQITTVALAAAWPADGLLVALQQAGWIVRTRDAGATWERVPGPGVGAEFSFPKLMLADAPNGGRVLFLANGSDSYVLPSCLPGCVPSATLLYRSTDDGATWQAVLERPAGVAVRSRLKLVLPPDFARTGVAFGLTGFDDTSVGQSVLLRSTDAGATWTLLDPAPGRALQDLDVSPAFQEDRALLLTTGLASRTWWDPERRQPLPEGPGLLVSTDDGDSWEAHADPLVDAGLFRLQFSPNFAQDGLLFGFARSSFDSRRRLVQSHDRGGSWESVPDLPSSTFCRRAVPECWARWSGAGRRDPLGGQWLRALSDVSHHRRRRWLDGGGATSQRHGPLPWLRSSTPAWCPRTPLGSAARGLQVVLVGRWRRALGAGPAGGWQACPAVDTEPLLRR